MIFLKKLRYREDILDNMGSSELTANLFRITQTEERFDILSEIAKYQLNVLNDAEKIKLLGGDINE